MVIHSLAQPVGVVHHRWAYNEITRQLIFVFVLIQNHGTYWELTNQNYGVRPFNPDPTSPPLPEEQTKSSKINDSYGGTAGPGTPFVRRDTATGTDLTNGRGEPAEPLLLPDGSPVRDANGNLREMF